MGRIWKFWKSPDRVGCDVCASVNNGRLISPGSYSLEKWCGPCLIAGGKLGATPSVLRDFEDTGILEDSREALRRRGLPVIH